MLTKHVSVALAVFASAFALSISAEDVSADEASKAVSAVDNFDVSNAPVSRDFLFNQLEEFKKQLLAEIGEGGVSAGGSGYHDVTLTEGQMILLGADCEVIFRGGSASAITSSFGASRSVFAAFRALPHETTARLSINKIRVFRLLFISPSFTCYNRWSSRHIGLLHIISRLAP